MEKKISAKELFQIIKEEAFKDINVESITTMNDNDQLEFMLKESDRILSDDALTSWFAGMFWESGVDGREMTKDYNPFFDPECRALMSDDEKLLCAFYLNMSGIIFDLYNQIPFDPMEIGIYDAAAEFFIDNKPLVKWIETSPYLNICMCLAQTMRLQAMALVLEVHYQPACDYLKKLSTEDYKIISSPTLTDVEPKEYINTILKALRTIDNHLAEGAEMGLSNEEIYLHDEMYGLMMDHFEPTIVPYAKKLNQSLHNLYNKYDWSSRFEGGTFNDQPREIQLNVKRLTDSFIREVQNMRDNNFGKNWINDDSLAMSYLIEHAQYMALGNFE